MKKILDLVKKEIINLKEDYFLVKDNLLKTYQKNKKDVILYILVLFFLYFLALMPLFRANYNYSDDLGRTMLGFRTWDGFSRFFSEYFSIVLHTDKMLSDISPFTQILASFILSISNTIMIFTISDNKKFSIFKVMAGLILGLYPCYLECLSYKFDAPYMAISILAMVLPFIFISKKNYIYALVTILSTILMTTTYQASSGIYIIMVLLLAYKKYVDNKNIKEIISFILISAVSYLIGLIIFRVFIMVPVNLYVSSSLLSIRNLIPGVLFNLKKFFGYTYHNFRPLWLAMMALINILFIINALFKKHNKKILLILVSVVLLFSINILSFGLYIVLEKTGIMARSMYGYGVMLSMISIYLVDQKNFINKLVVTYTGYAFFVFALIYGNSIYEQVRYTEFRIINLINEINSIDKISAYSKKEIEIRNTIGHSPVIEKRDMPLLKEMIPVNLAKRGTWELYYLNEYFKLKDTKFIYHFESNNLFDETKMHKVISNDFEDIYNLDNKYVVILKN